MNELPPRSFVEKPSRLAGRFVRRESHCLHISHGWWGWFCWRLATYDGYCAKHNRTCFHACPAAPPSVTGTE